MAVTKLNPEHLNITRGDLRHRALWALSGVRELTTKQIRLELGSTNKSDIAFRESVLTPMYMAGLIGVRPSSSDLWFITNEGIDKKLSVGDLPGFPPMREKTTRSLANEARARGPYVPLELTKPIVRPGAYDAFGLPTRTMGGLRWRDQRGTWGDAPGPFNVTAA